MDTRFILISFSEKRTPGYAGESRKNYIVKRPTGIMKVRSTNCTTNTKEVFFDGKRYSKSATHKMEVPISCGICNTHLNHTQAKRM